MNKNNKHDKCKKKIFCLNSKENRKQYAIVSLILAFVLLVGGTIAYFTDFAKTSTSGTAGTVAISIDNGINLLDDEGRDILNPGDLRDATLVVQNEGNKSIDVRTYISITAQSPLETLSNPYDMTFSGDGETQSEYDLYLRDDVEYIEGEGWKPKEGAKPLQYKSIDQDVINYILPEYSLNGNSDKYDEVETIEGVDSFNHTYDLVFIFNGQAGNEWQGTSVSIDVVVEAKQHENTDSEWTVVAKEDTVHGSIIRDLVDGEDIITARTNHTFRSTPFYGDQHDSDIVVFKTGVPTVLDEAMEVYSDEDIMMWVENGYRINGVEYPLNVMYISAIDGGVIQANELSTELFSRIARIKFIDFNNFDISTANDISYMFANASSLRAICSPDNWTEEFVGADSTNMFVGCEKLIGAVAYDENKVGIEMANQDGYFSNRKAFNEAIKAYCEELETHEHEYEFVWVTTDYSSCIKYNVYECTICHEEYINYDEMVGEGHNFTGSVAMTSKDGCKTITARDCNSCGETIEEITYNHTYENGVCTSCGLNEAGECVNHNYGSMEITEITCTDVVKQQQVCKNCGYANIVYESNGVTTRTIKSVGIATTNELYLQVAAECGLEIPYAFIGSNGSITGQIENISTGVGKPTATGDITRFSWDSYVVLSNDDTSAVVKFISEPLFECPCSNETHADIIVPDANTIAMLGCTCKSLSVSYDNCLVWVVEFTK